MADISDDEQIQKPKRTMTDKQKEALKKGRELAKANREAQKPKVAEAAEEPKPIPVKPRSKKDDPVKLRSKKEGSETLVSGEEVVEPKGKRISRKAEKVERIETPSPSPEPVVKKTRTPRVKAEKVVEVPKPVKPTKPSLQFV